MCSLIVYDCDMLGIQTLDGACRNVGGMLDLGPVLKIREEFLGPGWDPA